MLHLEFAPANLQGKVLGTIIGSTGVVVSMPTPLSKLAVDVTRLVYALNSAMGAVNANCAYYRHAFDSLDWDWELALERLDTPKDLKRLKVKLTNILGCFAIIETTDMHTGKFPANWHEYNPRLLEGVVNRMNPYDSSWFM